MIFDELNTAFRWYTSLSRQNRYKGQCAALCDFALPSTCNDLLPFQINTPSFGTPTTWLLKSLDGDQLVPTVTPGVDPAPLVWAGINNAVPSGVQLIDVTTLEVIAVADWSGATDLTLADLVTSLNTHVQLGTPVTYPWGANVNNYTASYDSSTNTFTVNAPSGVGASYNGFPIFFAKNGGAWGGINTQLDFSGGVDEIITWDYSDTYDISSCVEFINKYDAPDGTVYLTYNGGSLSGCIAGQIPCGKWYSTIEDDDDHVFYSEVFEVLLIENADTVFPTLDPPIFTGLRFYDDINNQTRYKSNCENSCNFYLKTDQTSLLPFMFRSASIGNIQSFKIIGINEDCETLIEISLLHQQPFLGYDYLYYNGDAITGLPCGKFYIQICDETQCWYSELIEIIDISSLSEFDYLLTDDGVILTTDDGIGLIVD